MAQETELHAIAQLPGGYLKWLKLAEPKIIAENLELENYMISVIEENDYVTVALKSLDAPQGSKGSGGTHPGYAVEIRKIDSKITRSYFLR